MMATGLLCVVGRAQGDAKKTPAEGPPANQAQAAVKPEKIMTKEQAAELFKSVDQIMAFAAQDTGLPGVPKVKRKLISRAEVTKYLIKNFDEDESAKRLQRSEIVLKKFGLLSRDFDLRPFLLSLLTEQIAGYYDDKTKTVNLLNWIDPDDQKPVLAHELTHAIQDQRVGLEKWGTDGFKGVSRTVGEDNLRIASDELETARQAVAEGQAMVVFVDYGLQGTGKTLADSPGLAEQMKQAASDPSDSPMMARAPLLLQRSLVFPYADGLGFEAALLAAGGKDLAFAGALAHPPGSSFEIMQPDKYLAHATVPVLRLPDVHAILDAEYEPYDLGVMGELDVDIMTSLFGGPELAKALAPNWNGGIYYAAQRKAASEAEKRTTASLGLLYYSRWRSAEAAARFKQMYEAQLGRKYSHLVERKQDEASGENLYTTDEGDVLLSLNGDGFFISEGFPLMSARKLRENIVAAQGSGPVRLAAQPTHELTLEDARVLAGFGTMRFATAESYTR